MFPSFLDITLVNIITDRDTGRVKGFAFVMFENEDDAKDAIDGLDHTVSFGSTFTCDFDY